MTSSPHSSFSSFLSSSLQSSPWHIPLATQLFAMDPGAPGGGAYLASSHQSPFPEPTIASQPVPHPSWLMAVLLETRCSNSVHKLAPVQTGARFPAGNWLREGTFTAPGESRSCQAQVEFLQHLLLGVEPPSLPQLHLFTNHPYRHSNKNILGLSLIYT